MSHTREVKKGHQDLRHPYPKYWAAFLKKLWSRVFLVADVTSASLSPTSPACHDTSSVHIELWNIITTPPCFTSHINLLNKDKTSIATKLAPGLETSHAFVYCMSLAPTLKCFVTGNIELSPTGPSSLKVRVHATRVSDIMLQNGQIKWTSILWPPF